MEFTHEDMLQLLAELCRINILEHGIFVKSVKREGGDFMKRLISILLTLLLVPGLTACGNQKDSSVQNNAVTQENLAVSENDEAATELG